MERCLGGGPFRFKATPPPVWRPGNAGLCSSGHGTGSVWRERSQSKTPVASTSCDLAGTPSWRGLGLDPDFATTLPCGLQQMASLC